MHRNTQSHEVLIQYSDQAPSKGTIQIQQWSKHERLMNCIKVWAIAWVLMVMAVFVPILHFILVPLLFLAGPLLGIYFWQQTERILGGQGECPVCKADLKIEKGQVYWPLEELCTQCQRRLMIQLG